MTDLHMTDAERREWDGHRQAASDFIDACLVRIGVERAGTDEEAPCRESRVCAAEVSKLLLSVYLATLAAREGEGVSVSEDEMAAVAAFAGSLLAQAALAVTSPEFINHLRAPRGPAVPPEWRN